MPPILDRLRAETADLHRTAERTGVVAALLRGKAGLDAYRAFLRNLLPVYEALESALDRASAAGSSAARLAQPDLYRASRLKADLRRLGGEDAVVTDGARRYAARIEAVEHDSGRVAAHAYVRYLGDLNGGQILKRLVGRHLELDPDCLTFYDFPVEDPSRLASDYLVAIDEVARTSDEPGRTVDEARTAFELSIALGHEVWTASREGGLPPTAAP